MNPEANGPPPASPEFSLVRGGPVYRLACAMRVLGVQLGLPGLGIALAGATWGPLLLLAAAQGLALPRGTGEPFLMDFGTHARFLVAVPLLFAAEVWIDPKLQVFVRYVLESRLVVPAELPAMEAAIRTVTRMRDSVVAEAALLGLALATATAGVTADLAAGIPTWHMVGVGAGAYLTMAGWWYARVALPIFQFVVFRWAWRLVIWSVFLWRLSRLDLQLIPTRPDLAGGLGPLGNTQFFFAILSFAASAPLAGNFAEQMLFARMPLEQLLLPVVGLAVINLVVLLGPLFVFAPRLFAVKRRGLREYGVLAVDYTRSFDVKWIRSSAPREEPLLGTADLQSLADLGNSFAVIQRMQLVPFGRPLVMIILVATLAPMLPLLLLAFPFEELVAKSLRFLLGL